MTHVNLGQPSGLPGKWLKNIIFIIFEQLSVKCMDDKHIMLNNTGTEYLNIISYFNTVHIIYCMF